MTDLTTRIADARKEVDHRLRIKRELVPVDFRSVEDHPMLTEDKLFIEMADEIVRLTADRDTWRTNYFKDIESLQGDVTRLTAQLEKARKALEPFAKEAVNVVVNGEPDDTLIWDEVDSWLTAGHLRTAARVHAELAEKEKE